MKILKQFFVDIVFIFLSINFLSCMEPGPGDVENQLQVESLEVEQGPPVARVNSFVKWLGREVSRQFGLEKASREGGVNPGIDKIQENLTAYYDDYSKYNPSSEECYILDLSCGRTGVNLRWEDFAALYPKIETFMIDHTIRTIDLKDNSLTSFDLPADTILSILKSESLAVLDLGGTNPIARDPELDNEMVKFKGKLNVSLGIGKKIWNHILGGLVNWGQETIDIQDIDVVEMHANNLLIIDCNRRQYTFKKILNNEPASWLLKVAPGLVKFVIAAGTIGASWASTYYGRELFEASYDCLDLESFLTNICEYNVTSVL